MRKGNFVNWKSVDRFFCIFLSLRLIDIEQVLNTHTYNNFLLLCLIHAWKSQILWVNLGQAQYACHISSLWTLVSTVVSDTVLLLECTNRRLACIHWSTLMNLNVMVHPLGPLNENRDLFVTVDIGEFFPPPPPPPHILLNLLWNNAFVFHFFFFFRTISCERCAYKIRQRSKNILFIANHVEVTYRFSEFFHAINYKLSPLSVRKRLIF